MISREKDFNDYISHEMENSRDIDHYLFVFMSNKDETARDDPYFSAMVGPEQNIFSFRVGAFENVQLA